MKTGIKTTALMVLALCGATIVAADKARPAQKGTNNQQGARFVDTGAKEREAARQMARHKMDAPANGIKPGENQHWLQDFFARYDKRNVVPKKSEYDLFADEVAQLVKASPSSTPLLTIPDYAWERLEPAITEYELAAILAQAQGAQSTPAEKPAQVKSPTSPSVKQAPAKKLTLRQRRQRKKEAQIAKTYNLNGPVD